MFSELLLETNERYTFGHECMCHKCIGNVATLRMDIEDMMVILPSNDTMQGFLYSAHKALDCIW